MSTKHETEIMDAMCLIECLDFGDCKELYKNWNHGIYEFRDRVAMIAEFSHECWKLITGDDEIHCCFDSEFCPEFLARWMRHGIETTEFINVATGRRFAREMKADIIAAERGREPVTISRSDFAFLVELAEIRRDQWKGETGLCEYYESDTSERETMVSLITELLERVQQ